MRILPSPRLDSGPATAASLRRGRIRAERPDGGAVHVEYAAVALLVAGAAAMLLTTGIAGTITEGISTSVCRALGQDDCAQISADEDSSSDSAPAESALPAADPETLGMTPHEVPPGYPSTEDFEEAQDEIDEIREYLDEDNAWYKPWTWGGPDDPQDVMDDMSPEELNALYWSLGEDEIRELLGEDGIREITLRDLDLETLRRLRTIDPDGIEPDYDEVHGDNANEENGQADNDLGMGTVTDARLWGDDGNISSADLNQGGLGDCWWLAGMGAVADQEPGVIKEMIQRNDNGTYTVTFPDTGEEITVTPDIVVDENGGAAFSDPNDGVMWPSILEKAYAQREGGFDDIEGGWPKDAMETITGEDSDSHDAEDMTESQLDTWLNEENTAVTITTTGDHEGELYDKDPYSGGLARNHAYVVESVEDGKVELYNPWGDAHVTMTMDQFRQHLDTVETNSFG